MMKKIYLSTALALSMLCFSSCDLIEPGDITNPNVSEDDFLNAGNAMQTWVNGTEKEFAVSIGEYCQLMEILSDNYFNNYSRSSNVFDTPTLLPTDDDIRRLQRYIGNMRESANYGFNTVAQYDRNFTDSQKYTLLYIKAYSFILAGEYFTGLPMEVGGEAKPWNEHLQTALRVLDEAVGYASDDSQRSFIHTLKARVYHRLGDRQHAVDEAQTALAEDAEMLFQVKFDGENGVTNAAQEAIWGTWFQPLPRLDFLDPKYYQIKSTDQCPVTIAKSEENYLILAEAYLSSGDVESARVTLKNLISRIKQRTVVNGIEDHLENRYNGGTKHYPTGSHYKVAASSGAEYRSGLMIDRQSPVLISVPIVSGTSVTASMIDSAADAEGLLYLVYLMRQEVFFAEGRRPSDLGIRLPLCDVEAGNAVASARFMDAVIPDFVPRDGRMDAFTVDEAEKKVTIECDMNRIIVDNRRSEAVVPFF